MTQRNFRIPVFVLFFAIAISGCKKDKGNDGGSKTRKELLVGTWLITAATENPAVFDHNGDGTKDTDVYAAILPCDKDNLYTFLANGTYTADEGPIKCSASDPQIIETGTWTLSADEKTITSAGGSANVVEITPTTMKLSTDDTFRDTKYTQTITYTRK